MADDKKDVDASDLKARLGLKRRRRAPPGVPAQAADAGGAAAAAPARAQPTAEEIEAARARAAEAAAEQGPALEDFGLMGQDKTPLPSRLPQGPIYVTGAEDFEGSGKGKLIPLIGGLVVVAIVTFFLGRMLGAAVGQNELREQYIAEAKNVLTLVKDSKTQAGEPVLERIAQFQELIDSTVKDLDSLVEKGGDPLKLEPTMTRVVGDLKRFRDEGVFINPETVLREGVHNADTMTEVIRFATRTRMLHQKVSDFLDEAATYTKVAKPAGAMQRTVLVEYSEREIPAGPPPEEGKEPPKIKIPVSVGKWVEDTGRPQQVKLVDPNNPGKFEQDWQMMVKVKGEKDPVQVPTKEVMSLDLSEIYANQQTVVRLVLVNRFDQVMRNLQKVAQGIRWKPVEDALQEWAQKEP